MDVSNHFELDLKIQFQKGKTFFKMTENIEFINRTWLNATASQTTYVGGVAFFLTYLSEYLPYVLLIAFGEIVGIIGI